MKSKKDSRLALSGNRNDIKNNLTLQLVKIIGSPFVNKEFSDSLGKEKISALYTHSIKNRMPLLFLESLNHKNMLFEFSKTFQGQYSRYLKIFDAMAVVSDYLTSRDIEHAIFKSIKPFPDASVDIDTLIFDSQKYGSLLKGFSERGWKLLGYGPQSATFFDSEAEVGIDLYREISVSWVCYLDKERLESQVTRKMLPNNKEVFTLQTEADLLATIAHSVIKEQLFTLAEYYTLMIWLKTMKKEQLENFMNLIEKNNMAQSVKSFVTLACLIHKAAFGFVPDKILTLLKKLGIDRFEEKKLIKNGFKTPHRYHILTFTKSVKNKFIDEKTRKSFAFQGFKMMNIKFTKSVIVGILEHTIRQTY